MRILLVDDESEILAALAEVLTDLGHSVTCCGDGEDALARFADESFDLVLSDVRMPKMDGIQLAEALAERCPGLPIVLISGHGEDELVEQAAPGNSIGFLRKPVRIRDLQECIASVLPPPGTDAP